MSALFYRLGIDREILHEVSEFTDLDTFGTVPLLGRWKLPTVRLTGEQRLPDFYTSGAVPLVSAEFQQLCVRLAVNAEFLPVRVIESSGRQAGRSFVFMHMLERLECIDYQASDFDRYGSDTKFSIARFRRLAFLPEAIGETDLFRPARYPAIYCSAKFRQEAETQGLDVTFRSLEGQ